MTSVISQCTINPICYIKEALAAAFKHVIEPVIKFVFDHTIGWLIDQFAKILLQLISDAVDAVLKTIGVLWVKAPTPDLSNGGAVAFMQGALNPLMYVLIAVSVLVAGIKLAWDRRADAAKDLFRSLLTTIVVSALLLTMVRSLVKFGDVYADWIVGKAVGKGSLSDTMSDMVKFTGDGTGLFWVAIAVLVGITAVVLALIQLALMVVRAAGLIVVAVMVPVSAAATNTAFGQHWFKRMVGYLTVFVLYKPAAATVYATAIYLVHNTPKDAPHNVILNTITGVMMMLLAVLLMPALSRLVVPGSSR